MLDDLGELDLATRRLLCDATESGGCRRVGGTDYLPLDVRLVGVTWFDLVSNTDHSEPLLLDLIGAVQIELVPLRDISRTSYRSFGFCSIR